jgi:hypothetical protein
MSAPPFMQKGLAKNTFCPCYVIIITLGMGDSSSDSARKHLSLFMHIVKQIKNQRKIQVTLDFHSENLF